ANAAYLREKGLDVEVFDGFAQKWSVLYPLEDGTGWWMGCSFEEVRDALPGYAPAAVAVLMHPFLFAPFNRHEMLAFLQDIRACLPDRPVLLFDGYTGGMHYIEYDPADWIGPELADYVLRYETEESLAKTLNELKFGLRPATTEILPERRMDMKAL